MSDIAPLYSGEVQFRRYSDTSTQGQQIVLQVEDREALRPFIGMEGKRFMAVFVLLGDDETPQPPPEPATKRGWSGLGPKAAWLVKRCKEGEFQEWVGKQSGLGGAIGEPRVAQWCRETCGVSSRKDIDGNVVAERFFDELIRKPWTTRTKQPA